METVCLVKFNTDISKLEQNDENQNRLIIIMKQQIIEINSKRY
jgi:hypothetical protein